MTSRNILIADDDPSIIMIVSHIVKRAGYNPLTARDGKEAHRLLQKTPIDLLITDEVMPHITGTEIARWIRGQEHLRNLPIIIMSAEENPAAFSKALEDKTIDSFLPKPFQAKALGDLLEMYMSVYRRIDKRPA
jgi:CheY-like chemotaxis protein